MSLDKRFPVVARLTARGADAEPDAYPIVREACALYRELKGLREPVPEHLRVLALHPLGTPKR